MQINAQPNPQLLRLLCSPAITRHIKAIYEEGGLEQHATCQSYLQVQQEGSRQVSYNRLHYNLSVILAVGCRIRSP